MVKISYDSEGKILGAYDSLIQDVPTPFIEVEDSAWGNTHGKYLSSSVNLDTLELVVVKDDVKEQEDKDAVEVKALITEKINELAIEALKKDGKLDTQGKFVK
jgi:hypothetical protein